MKRLLLVGGVALLASGLFFWHLSRQSHSFGKLLGAPPADVGDLVDRPREYLHRIVAIEGVVSEPCGTAGCSFLFVGSASKRLRVDLADIGTQPSVWAGSTVRVEGLLVPCGDGYELWATGVTFNP